MTEQPDAPGAIERAARDLVDAERALHDAVTTARGQGRTWQQVAEVLGVTRQAAFKRFGHPTDPSTGEPLDPPPLLDAGVLAAEVFTDLAQGLVERVRERMTHACARELTRRRLTETWSSVLEFVGELMRVAASSSHTADGTRLPDGPVGLPAVGRCELAHEHGVMVGRVMVNRSGRIVGMVVRPGGVEETWPL